MKIGLALSGGGFRAIAYHLGLVRFLHDADILSQVTDITAVSGGSVIAAHLVLNWDRYNGSAKEFDEAAKELLTLVRLDVRNRIVRRFGLALALRGPRRLLGLSNRRLTLTGLLEQHYEQFLYGDTSLFQLPESPRLHLLATSVSEGRLSSFQREGLWMICRETSDAIRFDDFHISLATVPMAVTASSAFPGFFPPMELTGADVGARSGDFGRQAFTDGGVFDNLGVRMFRFLAMSSEAEQPPWDGVLVSDVGKRLQVQNDVHISGMVRTAMRASDILMDRVWQLETEKFKDAPGFVFARITDIVDPEDDPTALHPEIQRQLPAIRTDMDRFSDVEISSLIRQGYCVGRKTCRARPEVFGANLPQNPPWDPVIPATSRTTVAAEPNDGARNRYQPTKVTQEARSLFASSARRIWSTLFDYRDWVSYVYVPIILPILFLSPYLIVKSYERSHRVNKIIESLAQGGRDLEQMSRLLEGPVEPWVGTHAEELATDEKADLSGYLILQDLRILDLRNWNIVQGGDNSASSVFGYRRLKVQKIPGIQPSEPFRISVMALSPQTQVRFPVQQLQPRLYSRVLDSATTAKQIHWEVGADFAKVPAGNWVDLIYEQLSPGLFLRDGVGSTTLTFETEAETVELTRWLLMPRGTEYRAYKLIRYATGKPETAENVDVATEYLADDFTILAFKLLALKAGYTYEITWFYR
jgi:predicted acylesterase/phospholipase RssA